MPPRKKTKTTKKRNQSKTPELPSSSPGDKETRERHRMLLQQTIGFQERRQTSNDIAQYPLGSQPTNHYAGPPSSSQPTDHHPEPPSSQPTDHHPEPSTSSCAADPLPGSPKAKQPTNDPMADVRDTPSPALRVSKRDRKSHIPLPTSSPTVQDDASDSWLGTPIAAQQATVNPPDDTFEIVDIGFFDRQRVIGAKVCWGNGTTKWLEVESIMDSAKDQLFTAMYKKLLEIADFEQNVDEDVDGDERA